MIVLENVKEEVIKLLEKDNSGHGMDHVNRVVNLALKFAKKENAKEELVTLIALLHEVDDYKIFGEDNAKNLSNAKRIMCECNVPEEIQIEVCTSISNMGYHNRLNGIHPKSLEGKIVSDADMCDALGATIILRVYSFCLDNNELFFDEKTFPRENINQKEYMSKKGETGIGHFFEKILRLKDLMLTESGKEEAISRHQIVVDFLYHFFTEESAYDWLEYLDKYLQK